MKKYKIFISAVQGELKDERRAVKDSVLADVLLSEYFDLFLFEDAPAKSKSAEETYLDAVRTSDIYIGILGKESGNAGKDGVSPVEAEFREAKRTHKNILIYIKGKSTDDKSRDPRLQKLVGEIRDPKNGFSYKRFHDTPELARSVYASLIDFLKEEGVVGRGAFDGRLCEDATISDLDRAKLQWFTRTSRAARKFPLELEASARDILTHLNLLRNGSPTNAAILLFGKDPHKFFPQAEIKCLQLAGTEIEKPFLSYKMYGDNLFEQVDKAVGFVVDSIKQAVIQQRHTPQFKRPFEIPVFAVQEAIVNAVAHRNYNVSSGVQVMVFSDRVEVWNSGSLPPQLSVDDLRKPHTSYPANQLLANVLYLADYVQKAGTGTLEMIKQCRQQGTPEPEFISVKNVEFRTILPRDVFAQSALEKMGFNERQMKAVALVKERASISLADLKTSFPDVTERTLNRDLQQLVKKGVLKPKGQKKGRRYGF
jgi:predicted HTH transcriptional regulator